jgi:hypothetical protein
VPSLDKVAALIRWAPKYSLQQILSDTIEFSKKARNER